MPPFEAFSSENFHSFYVWKTKADAEEMLYWDAEEMLYWNIKEDAEENFHS